MTNDLCKTEHPTKEHSPEIDVVWLASRNVQSRTARLKVQRKPQITKTKASQHRSVSTTKRYAVCKNDEAALCVGSL